MDSRHWQWIPRPWHIVNVQGDQFSNINVMLNHVKGHAAPSDTVLEERILG